MQSYSRRYSTISNSYNIDLAKFLAKAAESGRTVTYGDVAKKFGGTARGWGRVLSAIAIRCKDAGLPLLSVLVVNAETGLPSVDAKLYADLGMGDSDALQAEQRRCYSHDWSRTPFGDSKE